MKNKIKNLGTFNAEPKFAYLWDRCVYELLYDSKRFTSELSALFSSHGVSKESHILDTCAGSGFPAIDMYKQGYENITCVDGSDDQIELFNNRAQDEKLDIRSNKVSWLDLGHHFKENGFDALMCKGSIWYAGGGWNTDFKPNREASLKLIKDTLTVFHSLLKKGGILYLDKFRDDELDHKDTVGYFEVGGKKKELIFWTTRNKEIKTRYARMIVKDIEMGKEESVPNITYDLKEEELEILLSEIGFAVKKIKLEEEKIFTSWFAIKN